MTAGKKEQREVKKFGKSVKRGLVNENTGMRTAKGIRRNERGQVLKNVAGTVGGAVAGGLASGLIANKVATPGTRKVAIHTTSPLGAGLGGAIGHSLTKKGGKAERTQRAINTSPYSNATISAYKASKNTAKFSTPKPPARGLTKTIKRK